MGKQLDIGQAREYISFYHFFLSLTICLLTLRDNAYFCFRYFDAGAGNINMVTYSQPIISQSGKFLGVATIDVTVDALCYGAQCVSSAARWVGHSMAFVMMSSIALFLGE